MTTIEEMDEFFNFEDAAQPIPIQHPNEIDIDALDFNSGLYDPNLAFAQLESDENSVTCLQHFEDQGPSNLNIVPQHESMMDMTPALGPGDFADFPRWIDGMYVATSPCVYCRRMRIHCKIIREGMRKGSCTSCVALGRTCSLTVGGNIQKPKPLFPGNTTSGLNVSEIDLLLRPAEQFPSLCDYCEGRGYQCKQFNAGGPVGECTSCVALDRQCSLAPNRQLGDWKVPDKRSPPNTYLPSKSPIDETSGGMMHNLSSPNLVGRNASEDNLNTENAQAEKTEPKVGARFSRESVRILRGWLSTHHRHPYPTDEQKECLNRQTGLNKTQITNWLANARRRGKVRAPRSTSPAPFNHPNAMDIPRRATPSIEQMLPLERWKASPPEHEPASATAIAKAVTNSTLASDYDSPYASYAHSDEWSNRSVGLREHSSASSLGTSHGTSHSSGGSFASAFSHQSKGSFGSFNSFGNRGRRRRRRQAPKPVKVISTGGPVRTFQCTFCTETFRTKHDWQRHEKSLHLSLERWVCCPDGPFQWCSESEKNQCVFCLLTDPPSGHAETHNYSSCADRSLEERTFYRKDHLRQHLNLVHDVKFQSGAMEPWKVASPEIRSRCGFCGIVMDSWSFRTDHLAEHFKGGKSMADWKGDWGFESQVLDIVENGIPPYLIHYERNSPQPFSLKTLPTDTRTLEDLVKIGLKEYVHDRVLEGTTPTDDDLLKEARGVIKKADEFRMPSGGQHLEVSWFRDLILESGSSPNASSPGSANNADVPWADKLESIKAKAPHNDLDSATITCGKERLLKAYVAQQQMLGLTPPDSELQIAACRILDEIEPQSNFKCEPAKKWFKYLIGSSTNWLCGFRKRNTIPRSDDLINETIRSTDEASIDYSIHNTGRLEREMIQWVNLQRAQDNIPSDADLQRQARLMVYKNDDPWNQTVFDDPALLHLFKRQQGLAPPNEDDFTMMHPLTEDDSTLLDDSASKCRASSPKTLHWDLQDTTLGVSTPNRGEIDTTNGSRTPAFNHSPINSNRNSTMSQPTANTNPTQPLKFFLNDANCYGRLVRELSRFVTTTVSINNPNRHVPTDAELQHQARVLVYDDDDPWNQTAADNAEWLMRFKRDVGLAPSPGPGLPVNNRSWQTSQGGSGFMPPYLNPSKNLNPTFGSEVAVRMEGKIYNVKASTAEKFAEGLKEGRCRPPGVVFCSRDLEEGLNQFVSGNMEIGITPTDDAIRSRAREILGTEETAADNAQLLEKFKALHGICKSSSELTGQMQTHLLDLNEEDLLARLDNELAMGGLEWTPFTPSPHTSASQLSDIASTCIDRYPSLLSIPLSQVDTDMSGSPRFGEPSIHSSPEVGLELAGPEDIIDDNHILGVQQTATTEEATDAAKDFAEIFRVHAATASPLGRKASANAGRLRGQVGRGFDGS